jgi:hypothetical protein
MPFTSMVVFMVKLSIATAIAGGLTSIVWVLIGGMLVGGLVGLGRHGSP